MDISPKRDLDHLNEQLNDLKIQFTYPTFYIDDHFEKIKTEICSQADKVSSNLRDFKLLQQINNKRISMISRINELKDACISNCPDNIVNDNQLEKYISDSIQSIELKLNQINLDYSSMNDSLFEDQYIASFNETSFMEESGLNFGFLNHEDLEYLNNQIDHVIYKLKRYLLRNQSLMFLTKYDCEKTLIDLYNMGCIYNLDDSGSEDKYDSFQMDMNTNEMDTFFGIFLQANTYISSKKEFLYLLDLVVNKKQTCHKLTTQFLKVNFFAPILEERLLRNCFKNNDIISIDLNNLFTKKQYKLAFNKFEFTSLNDDLFDDFNNLSDLFIDLANLKQIESHTFQGLKNLKYLFLKSKNPFQLLNRDLFVYLQSLTCLQFSNRDYLCKSGQIVPKDIFINLTNLKELILSHNCIVDLELGCFNGCIQLETIDLSSNKIKLLNFELFSQLNNLKNLNVSSNLINEIKEASQSTIQVLKIDSNKLNCIKVNYFRNLNNLTELYLRSNNIKQIEKSSFDSLTSLKRLNLAYNCINQINKLQFLNLSKLIWLDLSCNNLTLIEQNYFNISKSNLKILKLNLNEINLIESEAFSKLYRLEKLNLAFNKLETINKNTFTDLICLKFLNLSHNRLEVIKSYYFFIVKTPDLRTLDLSCNSIRLYEKDAFFYLKKLERVFLHKNKTLQVSHVDYHRNKECFKYKLPLHHIFNISYL